MPKIIPGLRERLIEEADRQLVVGGYSALTIRGLAKACQVAVGTVYNYFSSKEEFVASVLLVRWKTVLKAISDAAIVSKNTEGLIRCMHEQLCGFIEQYRVLFQDEEAVAVFTASMARYHELLRSQLAKPLLQFCSGEFEAEFVAEALLTWTVAGEGFDEIYQVIKKICK